MKKIHVLAPIPQAVLVAAALFVLLPALGTIIPLLREKNVFIACIVNIITATALASFYKEDLYRIIVFLMNFLMAMYAALFLIIYLIATNDSSASTSALATVLVALLTAPFILPLLWRTQKLLGNDEKSADIVLHTFVLGTIVQVIETTIFLAGILFLYLSYKPPF